MSDPTDEQLERARYLAGSFAGQNEPAEYADLIRAGLLRREYGGAAGLLGLAKLRLTDKAQALIAAATGGRA